MAEENGRGRVRIAVAEDEPDVRNTFVRLLELLGLEVDMAFVDLDMPVVDGLAAAEAISEKGIPVVLVSGHPDARQVVVENEPVIARICKPAGIDEVQRAIKKATDGKIASQTPS